MEPQIGYWIRRPYRYGKHPKWHLVESLINDVAIIRCGKRMAPRTLGLPLEVSEGIPLDKCQVCSF